VTVFGSSFVTYAIHYLVVRVIWRFVSGSGFAGGVVAAVFALLLVIYVWSKRPS
jgi:hypothetical protein